MDEVVPDVSRVTPAQGPVGPGPDPFGGTRTLPAGRRLLWYAQTPGRRSRQVAADVAVLLWCLAWALAGWAAYRAVRLLVAPTLDLAGGADRTAEQLRRGGDGVAGLPLVGEDAASPLRSAADAVADISASTTRLADLVGDLAVAVGLLVPLAPVAVVLLVWLALRLRFARRAGAASAMLAVGADPQLFALRALTTQPLPRLAAVSADPVGDWRRGDPEVTARLAGLELDRLGLRPPGDRAALPRR
ncbi:hypothetical protein [Jannaschia sp. R86511]|uniref:hypothetical protein n=1 Tax=Jannaschia sp. R86511 TaxID=3093853 RepID=UPI0036D2F3E8